MKDENKKGKKQSKKSFDLKNINLKIPKLNLTGKDNSGDEKTVKGKRHVPKRGNIPVSAGKTKKKVVRETLKKTEYVPEDTMKRAATYSESTGESTGRRRSARRPQRNQQTSSHSAQRKDRERQKLRKERLEARKAELFRKRLIMAGAAGIILLFVILLAACPGKKQDKETKSESATQTATQSVAETSASSTETTEEDAPVSTTEVRHFSFKVLLSDEMAGDSSVLTVNQFKEILQQLYDANYILVDIYSIAGIQKNEDGSTSFVATSLDIPAGKIPFVLSQRDVSYSLDRVGKGYATRLVVTEDGHLTNDYQRTDGAILRGSYDVVPILEDFIEEHPDFSYENARGVLGLTGYNGILGYRTTESLGMSLEEGNPYAVYGTFDVKAEIEACKPVIEALKTKGWHFACYGNNYCSYGAEYDIMTSDVDAWMTNVSDLIGGTDLMLFPCETDIGNWSEYKEDNQKYQYLKGLGFKYFFIEEKNNPSWLQIRSGYVRQGIKEIDCNDDFVQIMGE